MKIFIFFIILNFSYASQDPTFKEAESFVQMIKAKDVEDQLINSPKMGECLQKAQGLSGEEKKDSIRDCFSKELDQKSDDEIKEFAEDLKLKDFDKTASKSSTSIRKYLSERFKKAIHGKDFDDSKSYGTKDQNFIGQRKFFELYDSQIGKNVIMEISKYCLENLRFNNKPIEVNCQNMTSKPFTNCFVSVADQNNPKQTFQNVSPVGGNINDFFGTKVTEAKFGDLGNTAKDIEKFAKEDFSRGGEYLKAKYSLCIQGVKKLCQRYECNNTITDPKDEKCLQLISGWKPKASISNNTDLKLNKDDKTDSTGRLACNLVANLKAYRKNLVALKKTTQLMDKAKSKDSLGYDVGVAFKDIYSGNEKGQKSVDEITTISSKEITENDKIDEFNDLDNKAKALTDKCKASDLDSLDEECKSYLATEDSLNEIEVEFEAVTAFELKKIKALENDEEGLKKYLNENGMSVKDADPKELVRIISEKYKAERLAVINQLRDEFDKRNIKQNNQNPNAEEAQIQTQITKAAEEIKSRKDRVGTLIHYNNIISSFLEVTDEDGNNSQNITSFKVEQEGFEQFTKDEKQKQEADKYFQELGNSFDGGSQDSKDANKSSITIEGIEGIIGIEKDE